MTILITGCSTGIGRAAVVHLAAAGHHVTATARNVEDIRDLEGPNVRVLPLDVTDGKSVRTAVDDARSHSAITALVNNAGYGANYPVEEMPLAKGLAMFDVNVWGVHRMMQAVIPHMREAGRGRIINISSGAGYVSLPMMGYYAASKHAVRAVSVALRTEVRPFGIRVSLIEPGVIKTEFGTRAQAERAGSNVEGPYAKMHGRWNRRRTKDNYAGPEVIARQIVHACTSRMPRRHYRAPIDGKLAPWVNRLMPAAGLDWISRRVVPK